ncbi:hypothetical protein OIU76_001282 [Salix suchowensis]|nr:hypothetical protein OIU76_001282 [Salix suchowensis]
MEERCYMSEPLPFSSSSSCNSICNVLCTACSRVGTLLVNRCNEEQTNDNDNQRRSPSVIARLMGLDPLQDSSLDPSEHVNKPELRRSAFESRASRDMFQYQFTDEVGQRKRIEQ